MAYDESDSHEEEYDEDYDEYQVRENDIEENRHDIYYSNRYADDVSEYRHVTLPKQIAQYVPQGVLMTDAEWRSLGVQQSAGWEHYMIHAPEPHILLFKREKDYQLKYPNGVAAAGANGAAAPPAGAAQQQQQPGGAPAAVGQKPIPIAPAAAPAPAQVAKPQGQPKKRVAAPGNNAAPTGGHAAGGMAM
ncbi:hypothetical protein HDU89_008060 [Geranomyces variabilis]|nr:hypothetical protein HDU89_008060 [Geranomyces variabilis]